MHNSWWFKDRTSNEVEAKRAFFVSKGKNNTVTLDLASALVHFKYLNFQGCAVYSYGDSSGVDVVNGHHSWIYSGHDAAAQLEGLFGLDDVNKLNVFK